MHCRPERQRSCAPAVPDRFVPRPSARRLAERQRRLQGAEIDDVEVSWRPPAPRTATCAILQYHYSIILSALATARSALPPKADIQELTSPTGWPHRSESCQQAVCGRLRECKPINFKTMP